MGATLRWHSAYRSQQRRKFAPGLCDRKIPGVSKFNSCAAKTGPGLRNVAGGGHAAALAEQISNYLRAVKENDPDAVIHIFATALNGLLFYLVQYHQAMAPYIVYDFYFGRQVHKTY